MSKHTWLIDAGHGGIDSSGKYTTAPKKMHEFENGLVFYEGVVNRIYATELWNRLGDLEIDFGLVYHDWKDTYLHDRTKMANIIHAKKKNCILLSLHSNALDGAGPAKPKGFEIFTSPGETKSDKYAEIFARFYETHLPQFPFRSDTTDGDKDKEEKFTILTSSNCPAILIENLFFDELEQAEFLLSGHGKDQIVTCMVEAIRHIERSKDL